jgi:hypothetical protein
MIHFYDMKQNKLLYPLYTFIGITILIATYYLYTQTPREKEPISSKASPTMSFFVTSVNPGKGGNLGGLAGADAYCTTLAESEGMKGKEWHAYLSIQASGTEKTINARDRIGNGPWYNYKGELIATNITNLHSENTITKATALTEKGGVISGRGDTVNIHDILTGSNDQGTLVATSTDTTCRNWTSGDTGSAFVGHHDRIGVNESAAMKSWNSSHLTRGCSLEALKSTGGAGLFYCFAK